MHNVFSSYFSRPDAITMPSSIDAVALGARKRTRGHALAGWSCPRSGRLGLTPRGAVAAQLATSRCPRLLPLLRVAAALRVAPRQRRCRCRRIAALRCATSSPGR